MLIIRTRTNISKITCTALIVTGLISIGILLLTIVSNNQQASAQGIQKQSKLQQQQLSSLADTVTLQDTSMSVPAPNAPLNNQSIPYQIVVALPIRADGEI